MSDDAAAWMRDFMGRRHLERPDGRALYAYRCTSHEFNVLKRTLTLCASPTNQPRSSTIRAFVLYAAEWWQRRYDGGHWAWNPLLDSIGWQAVHYLELYEPVRAAWRWWRVDLVRLPTSVRYLGTFACQGGLPLALVGDASSRVTRYLRAVLRHTADYRQFVDDPIDLAQDQQHLLLPPTLRRDYVFRLAADLIEAVLDLRSKAEIEDDAPFDALDQAHPDWRRTMPLDLEDERARDLLTGLLQEAVHAQASPVKDFRVDRFLRYTDAGWRIGATVRLPASISADSLARQLRVSTAADLPPRLEVRLQSERRMGLYVKQPDGFVLPRDARAPTEIWDAEAQGEIRLRFVARGEVGDPVIPYRGSALTELPWSFRGDEDGSFVGEGSVSNRSPEMVVLVSDGCIPIRLEAPDESPLEHGKEPIRGPEVRVHGVDRILWRVSDPIAVETTSGRCVIRPSSGQTAEEEYRLTGQRFYDLQSDWSLFRGTPVLRVANAEQTFRAVPANEVEWRQGGGEWWQKPTGFGLWELRHIRYGELRYLGRVGILPERMGLSIEPGSNMSEGHLVLSEAEAVRVAGPNSEANLTVRDEGNTVRILATARDETNPPLGVQLRLHWPGAVELRVHVPFPGQGGHFARDDKHVDLVLAVDDLYGVRAIALSPDSNQRFFLEGELRAPDIGQLHRVAHFRYPLVRSDVKHELPLIDVRPMIETLLAASSSSDAHVTLRVVDGYQRKHSEVSVSRFTTALECDPDETFVFVPQTPDDKAPKIIEIIRIARPDLEPIPLATIDPHGGPHGVTLPQSQDAKLTRMLAMCRNDVSIQPVAIGGNQDARSTTISAEYAAKPSLQDAVNLSDLNARTAAIGYAMDAMLENKDPQHTDEEWSFLSESMLRAEGIPPTELDLLKMLATKPKLLIRCLFRLGSAPRKSLWRLEDEMPFSWLLVPRNIWWTEAKQAYDRLGKRLAGIMDGDHERLAREQVVSILDEGAERIFALNTVSNDVALRLEGGKLSKSFIEMVQRRRNEKTPEQIRMRVSLDDWPMGDGRREWTQELERGEMLGKLGLWQNPNESLSRQPLFDTPIAAAWCCFFSRPPTPRMTFLVKRIRAHDSEWFDLAYSTVWFQLAYVQDKSRSSK